MVSLTVVAVLILSLVLILLSCEVFTNGIEWLGLRLGLAETATGSILAAVGTAMPETVVPLIAIFLGTPEQGEEIGEGAILGAPFMLATLAMFIGGIAVYWAFSKKKRGPHLVLRKDHAERDIKYFLVMYMVALFAGLLGLQHAFDTSYVNYTLAGLLLAVYAFYLFRTLKDEKEEKENTCDPLYLCRIFGGEAEKGRLGFSMIVLQVISALIGIIIGAKYFVDSVEEVSTSMGVSPMVIAFIIAPIATELPEKFNSVIWYIRRKDTLGFGNITGAMVFQSSIPVSIGLLFTEWSLEMVNILSIVFALTASGWLLYSLKHYGHIGYRIMLASGSFYILYIAILLIYGT